jgi:hypothetical protein
MLTFLSLAPPFGPVATWSSGLDQFFCFKPRSCVKLHPSIVTSEVNCGLASEVRSMNTKWRFLHLTKTHLQAHKAWKQVRNLLFPQSCRRRP